jgi:hypothetical protein
MYARRITRGAPEVKRVDFGFPITAGQNAPTSVDGQNPTIGPGIRAVFGSANYSADLATGNASFERMRNDVVVKGMFFRYTFMHDDLNLSDSHATSAATAHAAVTPDCSQFVVQVLIVQAVANDTPTFADFYLADANAAYGAPQSNYNDASFNQSDYAYDTMSRWSVLNQRKFRILGSASTRVYPQAAAKRSTVVASGQYAAVVNVPAHVRHLTISIKKPILLSYSKASASDQASVTAGQVWQMCRVVGYSGAGMLQPAAKYMGCTLGSTDLYLGLNARIRYIG